MPAGNRRSSAATRSLVTARNAGHYAVVRAVARSVRRLPSKPLAGVDSVVPQRPHLFSIGPHRRLEALPIGRIQIGENISGRTYELALDDVAVSSDQRERAIEETPAAGPQTLSERIPFLHVGAETYRVSEDGYLMPTTPNQAPPDLRYFAQPPKK